MTRRWLPLIGVMALLAALAGCGGTPAPPVPPPSQPPARSPFPPRPAELKLDAIDPCTLLTPAQQGELAVSSGKVSYDQDSSHSPVCRWSNSPKRPQMGWLVRLQLRQSADYALNSATGHQLVQVGGFGAVQTAAGGQDPQRHCILLVDVAQGQSLWVQYANVLGDYEGLTHEKSCTLARTAAEDMVGNLRSLAR